MHTEPRKSEAESTEGPGGTVFTSPRSWVRVPDRPPNLFNDLAATRTVAPRSDRTSPSLQCKRCGGSGWEVRQIGEGVGAERDDCPECSGTGSPPSRSLAREKGQ